MSANSPSPETNPPSAATPPRLRPRQLRLLHLTNPIISRLGPELFASLPEDPGVYFFYDASGRLLYIGQSLNLRARITSYRHVSPERHPRRILRLVHRIARIEWRTCETGEAAIELERVLLLEHRPPFNRAGTWQPPPWYLYLEATQDQLLLRLDRSPPGKPSPQEQSSPNMAPPHPNLPWVGTSSEAGISVSDRMSPPEVVRAFPIPRAIHAVLCRCLIRLHHPQRPLSEYPSGILNFTAPLELSLPLPGQAVAAQHLLIEFFSGRPDRLLEAFLPLSVETVPTTAADTRDGAEPDSMSLYWHAQLDMLRHFATKKLPTCESSDSDQNAI